MSFIYQSQGFTIYPQRQVVERGQETIQVRPKTFALLLLLLEKPGEVLSKSYLLERVWDDVKVEEQVLVQSVRELRQLFGKADIIQTYPRKGYAWAAEVDKCDSVKTKPTPPATIAIQPRPFWRKAYALPVIMLAFGIILSTVLYQVHARTANTQTDVVLILPVKNLLPGNDYNWVPLGVMDQIINIMVSDRNTQVMPSEYVLQVMQFAHLPRTYESEKVTRLFEVSGATLVVETQLAGVVENYRLEYKLRTRSDVKRGVLFAKDMNQLVYQLGQAIASQTGQQLHNADSNAQLAFRNELMARGVEKLDQKEFAAAQTLFTSLLQLDPNNLYAHEQLIRAFAWDKKFAEAKAEITTTLALAGSKEQQTAARLNFYRARILLDETDIDGALASLDQADALAVASNEILVQAETSEARARIYKIQGNLALAQNSYERALTFNGVIRCAIGLSYIHIQLAHLFLQQGQQDQAQTHYSAAKQLIDTHQLNDMLADLKAVNLEKNPAISKI